MSLAAGIPTAWEVTEDLIRQVALSERVDLNAMALTPAMWWSSQGFGEPTYSGVLAALESTDAGRHARLRGYFEVRHGLGAQIEPSVAHAGLATLVAAGRVRVILTTNFDHLTERALEASGVSPQVVSDPRAVKGMIPLVHAPATVIKLHGDYTRPGLKNTAAELSSYPLAWTRLLAEVFDRYGLIVIGWSAEHDEALVQALERTVTRRYATFWASYRGDVREPARRLIAVREATQIDTGGADEFIEDLVDRVARLDEITRRRSRPRTLRVYTNAPVDSSPPLGWIALPLLWLRVSASVSRVTTETIGLIRPGEREKVVKALNTAALTAELEYASRRFPAAVAQTGLPATGASTVVIPWRPPAGSRQSIDAACYRLGGDGQQGISALVNIQTPGQMLGGQVRFTVDLGLSLAEPLDSGECAILVRDALRLTAGDLVESVGSLLPPDSGLDGVEVHLFAPTVVDQTNPRTGQLPDRLDLTAFGEPTRSIGALMGWAARVAEPMTARLASELVVEAFEYLMLAHGFLDPRSGLARIREMLGLPEQ
jgi:hypothetical protein